MLQEDNNEEAEESFEAALICNGKLGVGCLLRSGCEALRSGIEGLVVQGGVLYDVIEEAGVTTSLNIIFDVWSGVEVLVPLKELVYDEIEVLGVTTSSTTSPRMAPRRVPKTVDRVLASGNRESCPDVEVAFSTDVVLGETSGVDGRRVGIEVPLVLRGWTWV